MDADIGRRSNLGIQAQRLWSIALSPSEMLGAAWSSSLEVSAYENTTYWLPDLWQLRVDSLIFAAMGVSRKTWSDFWYFYSLYRVARNERSVWQLDRLSLAGRAKEGSDSMDAFHTDLNTMIRN